MWAFPHITPEVARTFLTAAGPSFLPGPRNILGLVVCHLGQNWEKPIWMVSKCRIWQSSKRKRLLHTFNANKKRMRCQRKASTFSQEYQGNCLTSTQLAIYNARHRRHRQTDGQTDRQKDRLFKYSWISKLKTLQCRAIAAAVAGMWEQFIYI